MSSKKLTTAQLAALMAILTACSKLVGFCREIVQANCFGAGSITDAYVMAQSIPNSLLAAVISAVGISYMPAFSKKQELEGSRAADLFTSRLINFLMMVIGACVLAGVLGAPVLVRLFAPGFDGQTAGLCAFYLRFSLFILFFSALNYILGAYLNYKGVFLPQLVYAFAENVMLVVFIFIAAAVDYRLLIFGPVTGALVKGLPHILSAKKAGFDYSPKFAPGEDVKEVLKLAFPVFLGGCASQINLAIDRILATGLVSGSLSALNYANMIITAISELSVMVFVSILYPKLNKAYVLGDMERVSDVSTRGIRLICLLSLPCSMGLMLYSGPIIELVYKRGSFDAGACELTSSALLWYALGLCFVSLSTLITKIYYSMHDTVTAVRCSAASVLLNIALNFALVGPMGHGGLALATSIASAVQTLLLAVWFKKKHPGVALMEDKKGLLVIFAVSAISVAASLAVFSLLPSGIFALIAAIACAVLVYLVLIFVFKLPETELVFDLLKVRK